ncbi:MAG: tetratricopeptide repeat protein [Bryobacterales bacterium]|nr:tetratricopeptide repeat protein [Bryobacterales bacterium]
MGRRISFLISLALGVCCVAGLMWMARHGAPVSAQTIPAIAVAYPEAESVFPPDFSPPTFLFRDPEAGNTRWRVEVRFGDGGAPLQAAVGGEWNKVGDIDYRAIAPTNRLPELTPEQAALRTWKPEPGIWEEIKRRSAAAPAELVFEGMASSEDTPRSRGGVRISTAKDPVGAPVFFRDVPLMPAEQEKGIIRPLPKAALPLVAWRLRYVDETRSRVLLEDMPTCANCHSFSKDGKTLGLDLDGPANDKGLYALVPIQKQMSIENKDVIAWSNFRGKLGGKMRVGFMSQVSPDGNHVVTMVNGDDFGFKATDAKAELTAAKASTGGAPLPKDVAGNFYVANFTDYRFLQVFYPTRGILAWYSRQTGKLESLPGADDPNFVHTNVTWSPDGKFLVFARAEAREAYPRGKELAKVANDPNETPVQYDLYRIPFNGGKGGKPEPIRGASSNGMSNSFPKISPDGKWLVYVQARNGLLMRPDSQLYIVPTDGGAPRRMRANTIRMNSWHSFSPNGRWLAFSSKSRSPYTQMYLTHIDENGNDSPAILVEDATAANRAVNIPEFVNIAKDEWMHIATPATEFYRRSDVALELMQRGEFEKSIAAWRDALAMDPNDVSALSNLGSTYTYAGRLAEATEQYRKALAADPENYKTRSNLGVALSRTGQTDEALVHLKRALELNPEDVPSLTALGGTLMQAGKLDEAVAALREAIEIEPTYTDAYNNLGGALSRKGAFAEAITLFEKGLSFEPNSVALLFNLGRARAAAGQMQDGLRAVERAAQLAQWQDLVILDRLSALYAEAGKMQDAVGMAHRALALAERQGDKATAASLRERIAEYQRAAANPGQ